MKRFIVIIQAIFLLLSCACSAGRNVDNPSAKEAANLRESPAEPEYSAAAQDTSAPLHTLVCLGDSIASGYALSDMENQRFSHLIAEKLSEQSGETWEEYNYAVPGDKSGDLLKLLKDGEASELENADTIIICIGANNVLGPAESFLMSYASYSLGKENGSDSGLSGKDIAEMYDEFRSDAQAGVTGLKEDIPEIMDYIRSVNKNADVIFTTVYNPYKNFDMEIDISGLPIPLNVMADTYVKPVNEVIESLADECGYDTADVYSAFDACSYPVVNADDSQSEYFADPHPNAEGHKLIADTVLQLIGK